MGASDGFYLVNCEASGSFGHFKSSGVAYFKDFKLGGGNDNDGKPDELKLFNDKVGGNFIDWETGQTQSMFYKDGHLHPAH